MRMPLLVGRTGRSWQGGACLREVHAAGGASLGGREAVAWAAGSKGKRGGTERPISTVTTGEQKAKLNTASSAVV